GEVSSYNGRRTESARAAGLVDDQVAVRRRTRHRLCPGRLICHRAGGVERDMRVRKGGWEERIRRATSQVQKHAGTEAQRSSDVTDNLVAAISKCPAQRRAACGGRDGEVVGHLNGV